LCAKLSFHEKVPFLLKLKFVHLPLCENFD